MLIRAGHGPIFVFNGRGYGHGLGLSQYGAKGYAEKKRNYKKILAHYYKGTKLKKVRGKTLRILVASRRKDIYFSAKKDFIIYYEARKKKYHIKGGHKYRAVPRGSRLLITDITTGKRIGWFKPHLRLLRGGGIKLLSADDNKIKGNVYRGWLRLVKKGNRIYVVNYIYSEHYLFSVVPKEMPTYWHIEALKSQAVAARTYAIKALKNKRSFYDMYTTTKSQVYTGLKAENSRSIAAVKRTAGQTLTYRNKIIHAVFHSSSGGKTENNENVWRGKAIPYLRSVRSPYEGKTAYWPKKRLLSRAYIQKRLGKYSRHRRWGVKGSLRTLRVAKRGKSPRVLKVKIYGTRGTSYITGGKLRKILRLRSNWYNIKRK